MVLDGFCPYILQVSASAEIGICLMTRRQIARPRADKRVEDAGALVPKRLRIPGGCKNQEKNGEKLPAFSSWRYELPPKSCIFLRESFREILDVFYSKRQALNDLLQNEIAWDADIHFAIYLTNFGRGGEVDECGVAPALGASADVINQLAEMQTSFSILLHSIDKLESYEEGYLIDGWKVNSDAYASNYKEWNVVKKAQDDVSGES